MHYELARQLLEGAREHRGEEYYEGLLESSGYDSWDECQYILEMVSEELEE